MNFPDEEATELVEAQWLRKYAGMLGYIQLGFVYQGLVFLHETTTEWYERFQTLLEDIESFQDIVIDDAHDRRRGRVSAVSTVGTIDSTFRRAVRKFPAPALGHCKPAHPEQATALAQAARLPQVLAELLVARGITSAVKRTPSSILSFPPARSALDAGHGCRRRAPGAGHRRARAGASLRRLRRGRHDRGGAAEDRDRDAGRRSAVSCAASTARGYGLQSSVLEAAYAEGVRLVITVDTGMRAFAEAETARRLGLDLIITDHHLPKADDACRRRWRFSIRISPAAAIRRNRCAARPLRSSSRRHC